MVAEPKLNHSINHHRGGLRNAVCIIKTYVNENKQTYDCTKNMDYACILVHSSATCHMAGTRQSATMEECQYSRAVITSKSLKIVVT